MVAKILEQLRKWAWLILSGVCLLLLVLFIWDLRIGAAYKVDKANFKKELALRDREISRLLDEKQAWVQKAAENLAAADEQAARNRDLEAAKAAKDRENEELKKKIAAMPADEIVAETRKRLGVVETEVYKNGLGIQFTLMAARKNLAYLYDANFYLVREQQFTLIIDGQKKEIVELRETIAGQQKAIEAGDLALSQYAQLKIAYAGILKKSEARAKWLRWTIGGVGTAVVGGGLYFLFVKRKG